MNRFQRSWGGPEPVPELTETPDFAKLTEYEQTNVYCLECNKHIRTDFVKSEFSMFRTKWEVCGDCRLGDGV